MWLLNGQFQTKNYLDQEEHTFFFLGLTFLIVLIFEMNIRNGLKVVHVRTDFLWGEHVSWAQNFMFIFSNPWLCDNLSVHIYVPVITFKLLLIQVFAVLKPGIELGFFPIILRGFILLLINVNCLGHKLRSSLLSELCSVYVIVKIRTKFTWFLLLGTKWLESID